MKKYPRPRLVGPGGIRYDKKEFISDIKEARIRMSEQLLKKIGTYWTGRAAGYSKVNQEELAGMQRRDWLEHIEIQIQKIWKDREKQSIHILDVGTGPGFFAIILAEAGYQVTAVDYTPASRQEKMPELWRNGLTSGRWTASVWNFPMKVLMW